MAPSLKSSNRSASRSSSRSPSKRAPKTVGEEVATIPARPPIVPRSIKFCLDPNRILDWHSKGIHSAAFMNGLSLFFPLGENFFIRSVNRHREFVEPGSALADDVKKFTQQESLHAREHEVYNDALRKYYAVDAIEWVIGTVLWFFDCGPRALALAGTVGLEHLTAVLAHTIICDDSVLTNSEPRYTALWNYHSLEESEHKAVAFDVYTRAYGRGTRAWIRRVAGFVIAMTIFLSLFFPVFIYMVYVAGGLFDVEGWRKLRTLQWAKAGPGQKEGVLRRLSPLIWDFMRQDFHPWDHDNSKELGRVKILLAALPPAPTTASSSARDDDE